MIRDLGEEVYPLDFLGEDQAHLVLHQRAHLSFGCEVKGIKFSSGGLEVTR